MLHNGFLYIMVNLLLIKRFWSCDFLQFKNFHKYIIKIWIKKFFLNLFYYRKFKEKKSILKCGYLEGIELSFPFFLFL